MSKHTIKIEDGRMQFVYSDELRSLTGEGPATIERASHVEPYKGGHPQDPLGWVADMRPSGGGVLGQNGEAHENREWGWTLPGGARLRPFQTREEALAEERVWLAKNKGL